MVPIRSRVFLAVVSLLFALTPAAVTAQQPPAPPLWIEKGLEPQHFRRVDFSLALGGLISSDWSDLVVLGSLSPASGALEQVLVRDMGVAPDSTIGASVTYWRDRYGVRFQAARSRSCVTVTTGCFDEPGAAFPSVGVDTWLYEVNGLVGLRPYTEGQRLWPYAFFGLGGITYDLDRPIMPSLDTFVRESGVTPGGQVVVVDEDGGDFLLGLEEVTLESGLAGSLGIGTDLRLPVGGGAIALRLEAADHVVRSPIDLRVVELGAGHHGVGPPVERRVDFGWVHNLRLAAGIVLQFGF